MLYVSQKLFEKIFLPITTNDIMMIVERTLTKLTTSGLKMAIEIVCNILTTVVAEVVEAPSTVHFVAPVYPLDRSDTRWTLLHAQGGKVNRRGARYIWVRFFATLRTKLHPTCCTRSKVINGTFSFYNSVAVRCVAPPGVL